MARILVVDDERAITETLERVLALDGHVVTSVCDPARVPGMNLDRYDLLILDVMMSGLDGFELLRAIRSRVDAPVLFLTARIAEKDAVLGLGLGADDYLRKPFGVDELRAKVTAHLRRERRPHVSALAFDAGGTELRVLLASKQIEVGGQVVPPPSPNTRSASFSPDALGRCSRAPSCASTCSAGRAPRATTPSRCT